MASSSLRNVECPLCGNVDYFLSDGLYYCTLCQTQSQNVVEVDYTEVTGTVQSIAGSEKKKAKKIANEEKGEETIFSPYAMYEAYAIIFDRLAQALIRIGLPKSIKEAIFRLYALYLRRRGVAFCGKGSSINNDTPGRPFHSKFLIVPYRSLQRKRSSTTVKLELDNYVADVNKKDDSAMNRMFSEFLGEVDTPASLPSSPRPRKRRYSDTIILGSGSSDSDEDQPVIKDNLHSVFRHEVATEFTHFVLLFGVSSCLPSNCIDLGFNQSFSRWTKEGRLPIVEAHKLLPKPLADYKPLQLQFTHEVCWAHRSNVSSIFYRRTQWIATYIGYSPIVDFDVDFILTRFVQEFNLTKDILCRARHIYHLSPFLRYAFRFNPAEDELVRRTKAPTTPPEVAAVAILIVALKMTLGLDDHWEYFFSKLADEMAELAKPKERPFSFCRWQLQCKLRTAVAEGEAIQQVLSRSWIDRRDTWMHRVMEEIKFPTESNLRNNLKLDLSEYGIENEDAEKLASDAGKTIDVGSLRRLFEKFTPFNVSDPATIPRQPLYPLRETVGHLGILRRDKEDELDLRNVELFGHDFFNDSLTFLKDEKVQQNIQTTMHELYRVQIRREPRPVDLMFPCAIRNVQLGQVLIDKGKDQDLRIANMMENGNEFEISSNMTWLLKMCKNRLQERMWVLFRAVQRIEMNLDENLKRYSARARKMVEVI